MSGVAQVGAQVQLNALTRAVLPVVSGSAPTWQPGMFWIDTGHSNAIKTWNGSTWVTDLNLYLALCTADPTGQTTIAGITECADAGYARQACPFVLASATYPSIASNSGLIVFGPFSVNMALPVQWAALVSASSGTSGQLEQTWTLSQQWQVLATQTIDIPVGALTITQQ
jgi:hypothetical protein